MSLTLDTGVDFSTLHWQVDVLELPDDDGLIRSFKSISL